MQKTKGYRENKESKRKMAEDRRFPGAQVAWPWAEQREM